MNETFLQQISPKELAECMGVTIGFASQIKTGHRKLPEKHWEAVSRRFGVPVRDLRPDISKYFQEDTP